jgi:membrane-bound serine protease (ClpP class)
LITGMIGAVLLLVGLVGTAVSGDLASTATQEQIVRGGLVVLVGIGVGWVLAWMLIKRLGGMRSGRGIVLAEEVGRSDGPGSAAPSRIGGVGVTLTDLRPSGRIDLGGQTIDAVCSGRWIEAGTEVRITRDGLVVEVEPCE